MLILTSSSNYVTKDFVKFLPKPPQEMRCTFVPTAAEVEKGDLAWLDRDRQALKDVGFKVTDFSVTGKTALDVQNMLDTTDFLFVSGGNTFYLLQELQKAQAIPLIQKYVARGGIYCGSSAGSVVAAPDITLTANLDNIAEAPDLQNF